MRFSRVLFVLAAVCGLLHALPSFYWAAGGSALLDTVGQFALDMRASGDPSVTLMLVLVGMAKTAGALVPLVDHLVPPAHRWIRLVSWAGAAVLLAWGGAGTAGAWTGVLSGATSVAQPAVFGHAVLWDPLFVLWGLLLGAALWASHRSKPRADGAARHPGGA